MLLQKMITSKFPRSHLMNQLPAEFEHPLGQECTHSMGQYHIQEDQEHSYFGRKSISKVCLVETTSVVREKSFRSWKQLIVVQKQKHLPMKIHLMINNKIHFFSRSLALGLLSVSPFSSLFFFCQFFLQGSFSLFSAFGLLYYLILAPHPTHYVEFTRYFSFFDSAFLLLNLQRKYFFCNLSIKTTITGVMPIIIAFSALEKQHKGYTTANNSPFRQHF